MPDTGPVAPGAEQARLIRRNVLTCNTNGVVAALAANMVNPFLGLFALRLGASNAQIGLLSALPAAFSLMCAIPGGRLLDRAAHKQRLTFVLVVAARGFFVVYALAPLFRGPLGPWFLVAAFGVTNLPGSLANVAFQSLLAEVLPARGRATALAQRARLVSLAGILPLLVTGRLLDRLAFPIGYQLVFCGAFLVGLVEAWLILGLVELDGQGAPGAQAAGAVRRGATVAEVLGHREFAGYTFAAFILHLGWSMGGPLFTRYRVSVMGANASWLSLYAVVESLAAMSAAVLWARLGERRGYRRVLWWSAAAVAGNVWTLALIRALPLGVITSMWSGIFNTGTNLMMFNTLLEIAPPDRRATYVAYYTSAANLAALFGPMIAVMIMERLGIREALFVAGCIRVAGGLLFRHGLLALPARQARSVVRAAG